MDTSLQTRLEKIGFSPRSITHLVERLGGLIEVIEGLPTEGHIDVRTLNALRSAVPKLRGTCSDALIREAMLHYCKPPLLRMPLDFFFRMGSCLGWQTVRAAAAAIKNASALTHFSPGEVRGLAFVGRAHLILDTDEIIRARPKLELLQSVRGARRMVKRLRSNAEVLSTTSPSPMPRKVKAAGDKAPQDRAAQRPFPSSEEEKLKHALHQKFGAHRPHILVYGGDARAHRASAHRFYRLRMLHFTGEWIPVQKRDSGPLITSLEARLRRGDVAAVLVSTHSPTIFYEESVGVAKRCGIPLIRANIKGDASLKGALVRALKSLL